MGKVNPDKKMFMDTIKDMRLMVKQHYGSYNRDTMGINKKNTKVPYTHLMGRRQKIEGRFNQQKNRAKQQSIQYDSSMRLLNSNIIIEAKKHKDQFERNKYKFQGIKQGQIGKETNGILKLSKKDVMRINGKQFTKKPFQKSGNSHQHKDHQKQHPKSSFNKNKKQFNNKRHNKKGKGKRH